MASEIPFGDEPALFAWMEAHLYAAVLSDSCDAAGCGEQALAAHIRPVDESKIMVGRAKTVLWVDTCHIPENLYELEIKAVDSIRPGEVVFSATGDSKTNAPWGELMSTACAARGGRGQVTDGAIRDVRFIRALGLPVYAAGYRPVDSRGRGRVVDFDVPVTLGGVRVEPGDLVFGDVDGIVVVPRRVEREVLAAAYDKVTRESHSRDELREGKLLAEVYAKYGAL